MHVVVPFLALEALNHHKLERISEIRITYLIVVNSLLIVRLLTVAVETVVILVVQIEFVVIVLLL